MGFKPTAWLLNPCRPSGTGYHCITRPLRTLMHSEAHSAPTKEKRSAAVGVGIGVVCAVCRRRATLDWRWPHGPIRVLLADLVNRSSGNRRPEAGPAHALSWKPLWQVQLSAGSWGRAPGTAVARGHGS